MQRSIPDFPRFTEVTTGVLTDMVSLTSQYPPYSDFNAANVLSWDTDGRARISRLNGNLAICLSDYITGRGFYSFLGEHAVESTAGTLLDHAEATGAERSLRLVPEVGAQALLSNERFAVSEDNDGHDYILSLPEVIEKHGKHFAHLRRNVRKFVEHYGEETDFVELDLTDEAVQRQLTEVFTIRENAKHSNDAANELQAIQRLFSNAQCFSLQTFGLKIGESIQAFIVCELMPDDWAVGHFWKANTAYSGIYRYLMHCTAVALDAGGYSRLNIEQDLGIEGLRNMKQLLAPFERLKKYTVADQAAAESSQARNC